ncbi:DMT family transporter [Agrobacterium cavarae]|jgi:drug/metabolite transporter (DMT)-like permease|uniref:EamA family transporter n=2 Tax=Rhizobium/Agrobacterium group TaxID=227290 RepID=A0AA92C4S7_RHIRH|nr:MULTISPECIES: DMT family transporter [Rhizobium/Agrobacterium group]PVE55428.1 EamA family transporter [Rhizobium rhizogenes]PVE65650.1 EamA family transporter [Agrobacterium tumefaciens]PVE75714.1 EamA family transporter [Sphingomonas sp. TPD3009]TBN10540.1 DMT family transporter [Agrobacterium cavarae]
MALTDNTRGALLMALAMASFTVNDAFTKSVTPYINIGQILFVRGVMTCVLVYVIARHMGALRPLKTMLRPVILMRCLCEISASILYLKALSMMQFANVAAIMQSLPLAVTLGAALFLKEPVGWRRWTAILVGFLGVLVILRPGPEGFTSGALLVLGAMFVTAGRDLLTRRMYADVPSMAVTMTTTVVNTLFGAALIMPFGGWQPMDTYVWSHLVAAAFLVVIGYQAVITAMRSGDISFVAPFRYTSMIWAFSIGFFFFGDHLDVWTLSGTAIIVASGLYTFYRESRRHRAPIAKQAIGIE